MNRATLHAITAMTATLLSSAAFAQEGFGNVTFTVQVTGVHNVPTPEGGHRNVQINRVFRGKARLKYAGQGFAPVAVKGYDKAAFEREKDACERKSDEEAIAACQDEVQERQNAAERAAMSQGNPLAAAMQAPRVDVWANAGCSGELEIADKGTYRGITEGVGMTEGPYSLTLKQQVNENSPGSDGCSFNLTFNPQTQTAEINVDAGPSRVQALERIVATSRQIHLNPLDWSAVRKFEKGGLKVTGQKTSHSGVWSESGGEPLTLVGATRAKGEVVQTATRVTWEFTGQAK